MARFEKKISLSYKGRASVFTFFKASITVEGALALPLFLFAVVCFLYLLEIMVIQTTIRSGMHYACKNYAQEAYYAPLISADSIERDIVESIGAGRLNRSIVQNGSDGIDARKSYVSPGTGVLNCKVEYKVKLPIAVFGPLAMELKEEMRIKGWTGYVPGGFHGNIENTVFITEAGIVYHKKEDCTYLDLSIQTVLLSQIADLRNEYGEKYHACGTCPHIGGQSGVYITNTGNRFHTKLSCSGLKRTIYRVPESEVNGRRPCSRCGVS